MTTEVTATFHAAGARVGRRLRRVALVVCACLVAGGVTAAQAQTFTDTPLVAGATSIRAVHLMELLAR